MKGRSVRWLGIPHLWFGLLVGTYLIYFSLGGLASHAALETGALDLGIYDQVIWNTAHGRPFVYSAEPHHGSTFLATHLQPILLLLAPLYWLWSDVRVLILLQTVAVAAGAVPVYVLASWKLESYWAGLAFAFAYLMYPALQAVNIFIFHPESFLPLFLLSAFVLYEVSRRRLPVQWLSARWARALFWLTLVLTLAVKEDAALVLIAMGAYLFFFQRERRLGMTVAGVAALWFAVGVFAVIPSARGGAPSPFWRYYDHLGPSPGQALWTLVTRPGLVAESLLTPENGVMLLSLLLPLGLLPLLDVRLLLLAIPPLLISGLSSSPFMHRMEQFQYAAPIIPSVTLAAIYGLGRWRRNGRLGRYMPVAVVLLLLFSLAYHRVRGFTPLSRQFAWPTAGEHHRIGKALMDGIPPDASVMVQDALYPHLSQRQEITFGWPENDSVEYILLDVSHPSLPNGENVHAWLKDELQHRTDYGLVASWDGFLLLERGAPIRPFSEAFYDFARVDDPAIERPYAVEFENGMRFLGYDVLTKRDSELALALYWTASKPMEMNHFVRLYLMDEQGEIVARTELPQPTLVWYPTSQWRVGEIVRVLANTVTWSTEGMDRFGLGLAVLADEDTTKAEARLRIEIAPEEVRSDLLADATILRLGQFQRQFGAIWPTD